MENVSLPIAGCIKHGAKTGKKGKERPVELGYFIAKVPDAAMQHLLEKFNSVYNQSKELNIRFVSEDPYTEKRIRYNSGGTACYCYPNQSKAKEKANNKWTERDCLETCEHRTAPTGKKPACAVEGTLKFMIPEISQDRIWYIKTKSWFSINNIKDYINFQKHLNNSLINDYKLFLKPKEDIIDGQTFNNFVLDIVKSENINSNQVSNQILNQETATTAAKPKTQTTNKKEEVKPQPKEKKSKETTKTTIPTTPIQESTNDINIEIPKSEKQEPTGDDLKRYYVLIETKDVTISKKGKPTKYLEAKFCDKDSKEINAIIHPKYAKDMALCELGSQFLMDVEEFGQRLIVNNCEYLVKELKEAV